jgi:segregation and condensation protein A
VPYEVRTEVFEGPFDLLLHLILREEVELYDVSLSVIVDAYLTELERMDDIDLDSATEFLLIAATLVELKARRLLPGDDGLDLDEELALWEQRDLLLSRLVECKTFKDVSVVIQRMIGEASRSWPRTFGLEDRYVSLTPDILAGVTPDQLREGFLAAVRPRPKPTVDLDHVAPVRASVTDAVQELVQELPLLGGHASFRQLTEHCIERLEVVVRFLAILEMYKQGLVELDQLGTFGEIQVRWSAPAAGRFDVTAIDVYDG